MKCTLLRRYLISYVTDVEGDYNYFNRFVEMSRVVGRERNSDKYYLKSADAHFVFGGDSFDLGGGDLALSDALLQLKEDYPDRVHLILGNRDVNKMIFRTSIDRSLEKLSPEAAHQAVYSVESPIQKRVMGYADYLKKQNLPPQTTMPTFMKWLFRCRMGSPNVFEDRRAEIAQRSGHAKDEVPDEEVIEHFLMSSQKEDGIVYKYLQHGQMAVLIGRSLFVHGGVTKENVGYCPYPFSAVEAFTAKERMPGAMYADAKEWVTALNRLTREGFEEWVQHPRKAPDGDRTGGEYLRSFAYRYTPILYSVMVNSPINPTSLSAIHPEAAQYLFENRIDTVCCGHQPTGDSPTLVATEQGGLVIVADNSYCAADNSRGKAVAEVLIEQDAQQRDKRAVVHIHGRHADGKPFDYTVCNDGRDRISPLLGRELQDGWWTKLPSQDRKSIICHKTTNRFFNIDYKEVPVAEVEKQLQSRPRHI